MVTFLNILRWIFVVPVSILVATIASGIAAIAMSLWHEPNFVGDIFVVTFGGVIAGLSIIYVTVKIAPSYKWIAAIVMGVIYIVVMIFNIYFAWIQKNYVDMWGSIVIIITLSAILYNIKSNTEAMVNVRII